MCVVNMMQCNDAFIKSIPTKFIIYYDFNFNFHLSLISSYISKEMIEIKLQFGVKSEYCILHFEMNLLCDDEIFFKVNYSF